MALQKFGPFELERRLGVGGMAETFVAVRRGPGGFEQKVCVKRILPALENDAEFVRLFLEEARLAAQLRHANVVQVVDFGAQDGQHYMALELVEGCDLRALLKGLAARGETITSGVLVFVATELAQALDFAHGRPSPIVHRDVSPSNVLLSFAGEVKLSDFGIARAVKSNDFTSTAQVKGKVPYMAPEYALAGRVDPRVDLFALGIVLYESLAGRRPYDGATELDTLRRIEAGDHVPLGELCPTVPKAFVDAIERLISPKADARFATANDFLDALVDVSPPPTARRILGELVRRIARTEPAREPAMVSPPGEPVDPVAHTAPAVTAAAKPSRPGDATTEPTGDGGALPSVEAAPTPTPPTTPRIVGGVPSTAAEPAQAVGPSDPTRTRPAQRAEIARVETALLGAPTAGSPSPPTSPTPEPPTEVGTFDPPLAAPAKRTSRVPLVAALAVAVLAVAGAAAWTTVAGGGAADHGGGVRPSAPTQPPSPAPLPVPVRPTTPTIVGGGAPPAIVGASPTATAPTDAGVARPAHLTVTAYPFATVSIDGERHGRSPVEADVPPGRHVVTLTNGTVVRQRRVDLVAGQRRQLEVSME